MRNTPLYVSLTTLPSRIGRIRDTIESLLSQTLIPDKIFISIPDRSVRENRGYVLPDWLQGELSPRVEVVRCSQDGSRYQGPGLPLPDFPARMPDCGRRRLEVQPSRDRETVCGAGFPDHQDLWSSSSFTSRDRSRFGQGADRISFYTPNLAGIEDFAQVALRNRAVFVTDDLWVSLFLRNRGIRVRSLAIPLGPRRGGL